MPIYPAAAGLHCGSALLSTRETNAWLFINKILYDDLTNARRSFMIDYENVAAIDGYERRAEEEKQIISDATRLLACAHAQRFRDLVSCTVRFSREYQCDAVTVSKNKSAPRIRSA